MEIKSITTLTGNMDICSLTLFMLLLVIRNCYVRLF